MNYQNQKIIKINFRIEDDFIIVNSPIHYFIEIIYILRNYYSIFSHFKNLFNIYEFNQFHPHIIFIIQNYRFPDCICNFKQHTKIYYLVTALIYHFMKKVQNYCSRKMYCHKVYYLPFQFTNLPNSFTFSFFIFRIEIYFIKHRIN